MREVRYQMTIEPTFENDPIFENIVVDSPIYVTFIHIYIMAIELSEKLKYHERKSGCQ